jgi:hypothetical protein
MEPNLLFMLPDTVSNEIDPLIVGVCDNLNAMTTLSWESDNGISCAKNGL